MNYPKEIWVDTDLVGDDEPHENWQKYVLVEEYVVPKKWCAYCGKWGNHTSGSCEKLKRDTRINNYVQEP